MFDTSTALQYGFTRRNHSAASADGEGLGATCGAGAAGRITARRAGLAARGGALGVAASARSAQKPA
jgi:hypothetical protein